MTNGRQVVVTAVLTTALTALVAYVAFVIIRNKIIARNTWLSGYLT